PRARRCSKAKRLGSEAEPGSRRPTKRVFEPIASISSISSQGLVGSITGLQVAPHRKPSVVIPRLNQKVVVGTVFVSAMFMNIIDITIVNVALPTIGRDFPIAPTAVDA